MLGQDSNAKKSLKGIIREHLNRGASSLFIEKSLAIIDESAENKESFIAAAVWINKRISMFIDKDLAQRVYESLMVAIEKIDVPRGTKRRYVRVPFRKKVRVRHDGRNHELLSDNISEGGMYIRTDDPFPAGSRIEIALPLEGESLIHVTGVVLYKKEPLGKASKLPPGMAVEFKQVAEKDIRILREYIRKIPPRSDI